MFLCWIEVQKHLKVIVLKILCQCTSVQNEQGANNSTLQYNIKLNIIYLFDVTFKMHENIIHTYNIMNYVIILLEPQAYSAPINLFLTDSHWFHICTDCATQ